HQREQYLQQIQELAQQRPAMPAREPIVFEGNVPSDLTKNHLLRHLLESRQEPTRSREIQAWLGEAIAIQDPTAAVFRSQSGNNLLLVGQQGEAALGILTAALLSLAAQIPPASGEDPGTPVRFYVLDGSSQAEPQA